MSLVLKPREPSLILVPTESKYEVKIKRTMQFFNNISRDVIKRDSLISFSALRYDRKSTRILNTISGNLYEPGVLITYMLS